MAIIKRQNKPPMLELGFLVGKFQQPVVSSCGLAVLRVFKERESSRTSHQVGQGWGLLSR